MKVTSTLFACAFLFITLALPAQQVQIKKGQSFATSPNFSEKNKVQFDTVPVALEFTADMGDSDILFLIDAGNLPGHPQLIFPHLHIPAGRGKANSTLDTLVILSTTRCPDTLSQDEFGYLKVAGSPEQFLTLRMVARRQYETRKPFWVEMGANLDLVDGLKPNNLFAGIILYNRDVRALTHRIGYDSTQKWGHRTQWAHNEGPKNLGLYAGVFESKAVSTVFNSNPQSIAYTTSRSLSHPSRDSAYLFKDTGEVKLNQQIRNIGLFFSPQIRLSRGSANEDGMHFFVSGWFEIQWQQISNSFDYSGLKRIDSIPIPLTQLGAYSVLKNSTSYEVYTHYEGIGLPVFFQEKEVNCFINPVVGISNQLSSSVLRQQLETDQGITQRQWSPFYAVQFRLNEEHYGFAFSGEVRGLLKPSDKPFVTLVLSKKFSISKLLEF